MLGVVAVNSGQRPSDIIGWDENEEGGEWWNRLQFDFIIVSEVLREMYGKN